MAVRIILFEDNEQLRKSLRILLEGVEGYEVSGDYENCEDAASVTKELEPDVVIMDKDKPCVN